MLIEAALVVAGIGATIAAAVVHRRREILSYNQRLMQVAGSCQGVLLEYGRYQRGRLSMTVDGVSGLLRSDLMMEEDVISTRIRFDWIPPATLRLAPENWWDKVRSLFGRGDLRVGDAGFDGRFRILGEPPAWIAEVLDARSQTLIDLLQELGGGVRIDLGSAGFNVELRKDLVATPTVLQLALEAAIELLRRWRAVAAGKDALLSAVAVAASGRCPVCATDIVASPRRCPRCRTEHHAECWRYLGGCGIYGCEARASGLPPDRSALPAKGGPS